MTGESAHTTSEESMVLGLILPYECAPHLLITVDEVAITSHYKQMKEPLNQSIHYRKYRQYPLTLHC